MHKSRILNRVLAVSALFGLVTAAYLLWARPYQLHWGATDEEINREMPGDDLNRTPAFFATRAITIQGTPREIWPWLVQMGYGRAGFYGYDILENLGSSRGIRSADTILPEFENFRVGDEVPISAVAHDVFYAIEPDQYLIWAGKTSEGKLDGDYGAFTWALYPVDASHTRLVSRIRWSYHWTQPGSLALELFTEFTDHLAVRKILLGVKERVEGRVEPMVQQNIEFAIYVASALVFVASIVVILLRPLTWRSWLAGVAVGAVLLITWYAPISIWIGAILMLLALWGLRQAPNQVKNAEKMSSERSNGKMGI